MRLFLLYFIALTVLISGCAQHNYSYIPLMPNEPAFSYKGQFKTSGAVGFNHIEGQAAFSPINHVSILAGGFRGTDKQWSSEYGAAGYYDFNIGYKKLFLSTGCTLGEGEVRGEVIDEQIDHNYSTYERINGYYQSVNFQTSLYFHLNKKNPLQILGIVFKHSRINYSYLIKDYILKLQYLNLFEYNGFHENNLMVTGNYFMLFGHMESRRHPFYFNWQFGVKPTSKITELVDKSQTGNLVPNELALNMALGIRLNFY